MPARHLVPERVRRHRQAEHGAGVQGLERRRGRVRAAAEPPHEQLTAPVSGHGQVRDPLGRREGGDVDGVAAKDLDASTVGDVPEAHGPVGGARQEEVLHPGASRKGERGDAVVVAHERAREGGVAIGARRRRRRRFGGAFVPDRRSLASPVGSKEDDRVARGVRVDVVAPHAPIGERGAVPVGRGRDGDAVLNLRSGRHRPNYD